MSYPGAHVSEEGCRKYDRRGCGFSVGTLVIEDGFVLIAFDLRGYATLSVCSRCQSRTSMRLQTQNCSHQLERRRSLAVVHTQRLCDDKVPGHTCYMPSRSSLRGLAERIRKVGSSLVRVRSREPFCFHGDSGQQSPEGIETPDRALFLRGAKPTLNLPRWVHEVRRTGGRWDRDNFPC